jgi:hypothetical protein
VVVDKELEAKYGLEVADYWRVEGLVEVLDYGRFGGLIQVLVTDYSPPKLGGVAARSADGAVCSKTNSTD